MDEAFKLADAVELITPARFLFDVGQTPKEWNKKMLEDPHFKVLRYESDGTVIFPNTDIKGGVAISYHDIKKDFGPIGIYTQFDELNSIIKKVTSSCTSYLSDIVSSRGLYRFSDIAFADHPDISNRVGNGTGNMLATNVLDVLLDVFLDNPVQNGVKIYGLIDKKRGFKYTYCKYISPNPYLNTFNVLLTKTNNNGTFGETLTSTIIASPGEGATDTFISIGTFSSILEAENLAKYLKTKFARAMLGVKKVTQDNPSSVWSYVPFLDFTNSDIDWSLSIPHIDGELYKKYNFSDKEIEFIETHVQEMK